MRISQFAPQFSLNDLFRCFWRTTWQTTISSESLPSSGRALHRWIIIGVNLPKKSIFSLGVFADPGGDNLPVHREQEASDLLQNPLGNPQSPLRLLLWGPHTKGWNSYQVNRSSLLHAQLILILVLLLIPMLLVIPTLVTDFAAHSGCVSFCSFTLQTPQTWSVATTGSGSRSSATCKYAEYNYDFSP